MSDHIRRTIEELEIDIEKQERKTNSLRETVNLLLLKIGEEPRFEISDRSPVATSASVIAPDAFVGKALNSAVQSILSARKLSRPNDAPASPEEILDALTKGGFDDYQRNSPEEALNRLKISLGKSSHTFRKVGNRFGLASWYGAKRPQRASQASANGPTITPIPDPSDDDESIDEDGRK